MSDLLKPLSEDILYKYILQFFKHICINSRQQSIVPNNLRLVYTPSLPR